jgi:starvation-inducible DNA-binding protein
MFTATTSDRASSIDIDIDIKGEDRADIAEGPSGVLADTYTLYLQTHNFHWNVEGRMFNTLPLMFMKQCTELWNALDALAERLRALGSPAPASFARFAELASIEGIEGVPSALDMVRTLVLGHATVAPASMSWQGLTAAQICEQIKDPARNGGRTLAKIHEHLALDTLVGWAWSPGAGRNPAPGTQQQFGQLIAAWIETGAACQTK